MLLLKTTLLSLLTTASAHVIRASDSKPISTSSTNWCGSSSVHGGKELRRSFDLDHILPRHANVSSHLVVDTYFHIVANSTKPQDGYLSNSTISDQFRVLNTTFSSTGISFRLKGVTRTVNKTWSTSSDEEDHYAMKRALRKGSYKTLNVYFRTVVGISDDGSELLGQCTFPDDVKNKSREFYDDGCMVLHSTVPGGTTVDADLGMTTTHEVGHWFGLYHTFEGGCDGQGDLVADTPAEGEPGRGCLVGRDTCPGLEGTDPVRNYMDYSAE
ncbi:hypothetical protein OQA88_5277 [Cercophora sp. LCS_1]